jgi:hypothetical protein
VTPTARRLLGTVGTRATRALSVRESADLVQIDTYAEPKGVAYERTKAEERRERSRVCARERVDPGVPQRAPHNPKSPLSTPDPPCSPEYPSEYPSVQPH